MTTGFVFLNEKGQFAREGESCDHGPTRKVIVWGELNEATVWAFPAWVVNTHPSLKGCSFVPASAERTVKLDGI